MRGRPFPLLLGEPARSRPTQPLGNSVILKTHLVMAGWCTSQGHPWAWGWDLPLGLVPLLPLPVLPISFQPSLPAVGRLWGTCVTLSLHLASSLPGQREGTGAGLSGCAQPKAEGMDLTLLDRWEHSMPGCEPQLPPDYLVIFWVLTSGSFNSRVRRHKIPASWGPQS